MRTAELRYRMRIDDDDANAWELFPASSTWGSSNRVRWRRWLPPCGAWSAVTARACLMSTATSRTTFMQKRRWAPDRVVWRRSPYVVSIVMFTLFAGTVLVV